MLDFVSRIVVGIAVLGFMVGVFQLIEGLPMVGGYLIGASVGALVTAALLDGVSRAINSLERIRNELRRWRMEQQEG